MPTKKCTWEIVAEDFNSPFIRNYLASSLFFKYPKLLNIPYIAIGIVSDAGTIKYITKMKNWIQCHKALKRKALADYNFVENLIDKFLDYGKTFTQWTEKEIMRKDVSKFTALLLFKIYKQFIEKQATLYALGVIIPILDFQNFSFVENNLEKFLKSKVSGGDYAEYYRIFTEPSHNSCAQDQEEDLLRLIQKFYFNTKWLADIKIKKLEELKQIYPTFYRALQNHTKKYNWVYYVYSGPAYTEANFLDFIKNYLENGVDPKKKLQEIKIKKKKTLILKKLYIKKLRPDKFNLVILKLAGKIVWAKPRRKDLQSKAYYHFEKIQREIGRRLNLSLNQVRSTMPEMLKNGLKGGKIDLEIINEVSKFHVCLNQSNGKMKVMFGKEAKNFFAKQVKKEKIINKNLSEFKGNCAYAGMAEGRVKIINQPQDMEKMKKGDILVSIATMPNIVPAIKKAMAIITNEGGLTCHAAIVSRELGIPCVIGTKIATKVLKDGDLVEVDANQGIVKIIKRS